MATRMNTLKTLVDQEVWGDITIHNGKFLDDDNVITKSFLNTTIDEFRNELIDIFPVNFRSFLENDDEVIDILRRALITFITTNVEVRGTAKDYIIQLISEDLDTQNNIKNQTSWLILND